MWWSRETKSKTILLQTLPNYSQLLTIMDSLSNNIYAEVLKLYESGDGFEFFDVKNSLYYDLFYHYSKEDLTWKLSHEESTIWLLNV